MAFDAKNLPSNLVEQYNKNHCGLLVGAGASVGAGLPDWGGFLEVLVQEALSNHTIVEDKAAEYRKLIADKTEVNFITRHDMDKREGNHNVRKGTLISMDKANLEYNSNGTTESVYLSDVVEMVLPRKKK